MQYSDVVVVLKDHSEATQDLRGLYILPSTYLCTTTDLTSDT
jgi:hypothetical protein